ncbi:MAG: hypothetical protein GY874_12800 [Desulfobacteraceae bacterium]|nr:hypothetical protein [Desulfobacteraceae bacterium]
MLSDDQFRLLLAHFDRPWAGFRKVRKGIKKRIRRHMAQLDCRCFEHYLALVQDDPEIGHACQQKLVVTITRFFRDRQLWDHLCHVILPGLIRLFPNGIRAWSAGCSGGEEPYSLAMVWHVLNENLNTQVPLDILATDIRSDCLERAQKAVYYKNSVKEVPQDLLTRYFHISKNEKHFILRPELKSIVRLMRHDVLDFPIEKDFHLLFLRNNLLTYYQGDVLEQALKRILKSLSMDRYLVLGSHERLPALPLPLLRDKNCPWFYKKTA